MIEVRGLTVRLDGNLIVDGVDLDVAEGEWVTIIGPNGAGKSTALRAIGGLIPFHGSVSLGAVRASDPPLAVRASDPPLAVRGSDSPLAVRGSDSPLAVRASDSPRVVRGSDLPRVVRVEKMSRRERARTVAGVAQSPVVPPGMRVLDYVLLGRTPYIAPLGRESASDLSAVDEVLIALDLTAFADRRLETLSGGERQRVFLARALAQGARILLLDEPTSALDIGHQQEVLELIDRLRGARGLTVLATMHDLSTAGEYADRMVLLDAGRVAAAGTPREVLTEDLLATHYRVRVKVIDGERGPLVVPVRGRV